MKLSPWSIALLAIAGCAGDRAPAASPGAQEAGDCVPRVREARRAATDSLFVNALSLVESCPEALTEALVELWKSPSIPPTAAHHLRGISALVHDRRLVAAVETVARDPGRPIETRTEALSTLSYYLQPGHWVEFAFMSDHPDSASLRIFTGQMEGLVVKVGRDTIPAAFSTDFRQLLGTLRDTDTAAAIRSAARRFLQILDAQSKPGS